MSTEVRPNGPGPGIPRGPGKPAPPASPVEKIDAVQSTVQSTPAPTQSTAAVTEPSAEPEETGEPEPVEAPARVELTGEQKKALFDAYDALATKEAELTSRLEVLKEEKSKAVKAILEGTGKPGPFEWKGKKLKIVSKKDTYFFRSESAEVDKIG